VRRLREWISGHAVAHDDQRLELDQLTSEVEDGLREIDFDEVTVEDRVTFVEYAVVWQVRRALRCGQFDVALAIQRYGVRRIAELNADAPNVHPHGHLRLLGERRGSSRGEERPRP